MTRNPKQNHWPQHRLAVFVRIASIFYYVLLLLALSGCASTPFETHQYPEYAHICLRFDRTGVLANKSAIATARTVMAAGNFKRVVVLAHGWGYRAEESEPTYEEMIAKYCDAYISLDGTHRIHDLFFVTVSWNSRMTAVTDLLSAILPAHSSGDFLSGYLIEPVLYPFTYWSMSDLADRIGHVGLRSALEDILITESEWHADVPEFHLVGHSFGARIVNALATPPGQYVPLKSHESSCQPVPQYEFLKETIGRQPFIYRDRIRSVFLLCAPLTEGSMYNYFRFVAGFPPEKGYSYFVAVNEHDYSQSFLFPLGNFLRSTVYSAQYENKYRREPEPGTFKGWRQEVDLSFRKNVASSMFALVLFPITYTRSQFRSFFKNPIDWSMGSLSQIPVVELAPNAIAEAMGRPHWGTRSTGIFNLGPFLTSVSYPSASNFDAWGPCAPSRDRLLTAPEVMNPGFRPEPVQFVDVSPLMKEGWFGQNVHNPYSYLLNCVDVKGSHSDFHATELWRLIVGTCELSPVPTPPAAATSEQRSPDPHRQHSVHTGSPDMRRRSDDGREACPAGPGR